MKIRSYSILLFIGFLVLGSYQVAVGAEENSMAAGSLAGSQDKVVVQDGHVFHNTANIWNHVTNFGLIGSMPTSSAGFSSAPSARWPGETGDDYLYAGGLWIGGRVLGESLVSTGAYEFELMPTDAEGDTIFSTYRGALGGNRYPWNDADDDADGLEDEDPLNGLDDDGDGLVDEDFAAIGNQHFVCGYNDFQAMTQQAYPDHTPMQLAVVQQSIQWSGPLQEDFIGYDFTITNVGVLPVEDIFVGMFSDFDIGSAGDDLPGFVSLLAPASDGSQVKVQLTYMYDGADSGALDGYVGWVLCGHTTDPSAVTAPLEVGIRSHRIFRGQMPFSQGGDPTNDAERYESLSLLQWDGTAPIQQVDDYRTLMSVGPFPLLDQEESISFQVALVMGGSLDELISHAAEAVATYRGRDFDRDGDPANGDEFTVHWLPLDMGPVATGNGRLAAKTVSGQAELRIDTNLDREPGLMVVRRSARGVNERRWTVTDLTPAGAYEQNRRYSLVDTDQEAWPRVYDLILEGSAGTQLLDSVSLDLPRDMAMALKASPNPFNPKVNIQFTLPQAGKALIQVFDIRGHLVRTLWDGPHPGGSDSIVWQGKDAQGRAMASGVYQVRLTTEDRLIKERITLVR